MVHCVSCNVVLPLLLLEETIYLKFKGFFGARFTGFEVEYSAETSPMVAQLSSGFISIYSVQKVINELAI